jgi:tetratricopeptide (TPR) repeat protein
MRSCNYCGKENDDASANCVGCGCQLVESDNKDGQSLRYIFRVFIGLLGIGLLYLFFAYGIWRAGLKAWMIFGALTGLFIGYGIGGDIWGARIFDLFTGQNSRRNVEKPSRKILPLLAVLFLVAVSVFLRNGADNGADYYYNSGCDKVSKGDKDGALANFNKAIELKPDFALAYNNRGSIKLDKGDLDGALADFNKTIELKSDNAEAYANRGNVETRRGDWNAAQADFDKAIELKPDDAQTYFNRGNLEMGNLERKTDYASVYANRGVIEYTKGDSYAAQTDFKKAIELNPELRVAIEAKGYLRNGINSN